MTMQDGKHVQVAYLKLTDVQEMGWRPMWEMKVEHFLNEAQANGAKHIVERRSEEAQFTEWFAYGHIGEIREGSAIE